MTGRSREESQCDFPAPKTVKCVASEAGAASFWAFSGLFCSPPRLRPLFLLSAYGSSATASFHKVFSVPASTVRRRRRSRRDATKADMYFFFFSLPLIELSQTVGGGHMQLKGRLKRFPKCDNAVWWPNVLLQELPLKAEEIISILSICLVIRFLFAQWKLSWLQPEMGEKKPANLFQHFSILLAVFHLYFPSPPPPLPF